MEEDRLVLKLASHFLSYPNRGTFKSEELLTIIKSIENTEIQDCLFKFYNYASSLTSKELCEQYVKQFDFSDKTTLYLTYNIFGENRERGLAFVKLKMEFAKAGYYLKDGELPDYYPLILEFASIADPTFVHKIYAIHKKGIDTLFQNLKEKNSPYGTVIAASILALENVIGMSQTQLKQDNVG